MDKKPASALTKGIVISLILIVVSLVTLIGNLQDQTWLQFVGYGIFVIGIIWSVSSFAKEINYNATFSKYFTHGFAVTAIVTCLMVIFTAVYFLLDPSIKQKALEEASKKMSENPKLTQEQIDQSLALTKKFFLPFALGAVVLGYLIFGTVVSLVTSAITKKDPRPEGGNDNNTSNLINSIG